MKAAKLRRKTRDELTDYFYHLLTDDDWELTDGLSYSDIAYAFLNAHWEVAAGCGRIEEREEEERRQRKSKPSPFLVGTNGRKRAKSPLDLFCRDCAVPPGTKCIDISWPHGFHELRVKEFLTWASVADCRRFVVNRRNARARYNILSPVEQAAALFTVGANDPKTEKKIS